MALARGTIVKPVEFNLPVLQAPTELMYQAMIGMQSEKDMYSALASTTPKAREIDSAWRKEYTKYVQDLSDSVAQAFASGNTEYAMKSLRKAKTNVQELWKPGGLANALEEGAIAEATEVARIKEAHEKDPTGAANALWALKKFRQGQQPLNYDYETGQYNRVGQAELYNYVDKEKILLELAKSAVPDMTEEDIVSGNWIVRLKEKGVSEDRIQGLFQAFLNRPEVQSQLEVDYFSQYGVDFNDLKLDESFYNVNWNDPTEEEQKKYRMVLLQIGLVHQQHARTVDSYTELDVKDKQRYLKEMGLYKGNIDGDFGSLSQEAEERYLKYVDDKHAKDIERLATNPKKYFIEEVAADPSRKLFYNLFGKEYSRTIKANPFAIENLQYSHKLSLQSNLFKLQNQYNQETYENAAVTPGVAASFDTTIQQLKGAAKTLEQNGKTLLGQLLKQPGMKAVFGILPDSKDSASTIAQLLKMYENTKGAPNPVEAFEAELDKLGYTVRFGADAASVHRAIAANSNDLNNALQMMEDGRSEYNSLKQMESQVIVDTGAVDKFFNEMKDELPKGTTRQKFVEMVDKAKSMTTDELKKDPVLKVFLRSAAASSIGSVPQNKASSMYELIQEEAMKRINEKGLPKSALTFTLTSADQRAAIGKANTELTAAFQANKAGFADAITGNNTKWTQLEDGKQKNVSGINLSGAKVAFSSNLSKPMLQVTTTEDGTFQLEIPKTGNARKIVTEAVREELAIALNRGDEEDLMLFSSIARQLNMTEADLGYSIIEVDNYNGKDPEAEPITTADGISIPETYTPVKEVTLADRMGNSYGFDIITWGKDNLQKWGVVSNGILMGPIQIANTEAGVGVMFDNQRSIGESAYSSYNDALNALEAVNQGLNIPTEQILQKLPKNAPAEFGNQHPAMDLLMSETLEYSAPVEEEE